MRSFYQILSGIAIVGTILPSLLFLMDRVNLDQAKLQMLLATVLWFVATPLWMGREKTVRGS